MTYLWNILNWIYQLLPTFLRRPRLTSYIYALHKPIRRLKLDFDTYRGFIRDEISQSIVSVESMQYWLNFYFDPTGQGIRVLDGTNTINHPVLWYPEEVAQDVHPVLWYPSESSDHLQLWYPYEVDAQPDFIVQLPLGINVTPQLTAFIDKLKLPGFSWEYQFAGVQ